jgi:hypothetical protein
MSRKQRKLELLSQAEQQALNEAVDKHNQLFNEIMGHVIENGVYMVDGEIHFSQPPQELGREYYQNFEDNIEQHVKSGRVSMIIGGAV